MNARKGRASKCFHVPKGVSSVTKYFLCFETVIAFDFGALLRANRLPNDKTKARFGFRSSNYVRQTIMVIQDMILEACMTKIVSASRNDFFAFLPKSGHFSYIKIFNFEKARKLPFLKSKYLRNYWELSLKLGTYGKLRSCSF